MKLKVMKKLAYEGCKPVAAILGKDATLSEMGRYVVVEADEKGLSCSVHRSDIVGRATIEVDKVPAADGKALLELEEAGRFVTDGAFLIGLLSNGKMEGDLKIDFKQPSKQSQQDGDELAVIGTAKVTTSNLKASVGCVEDRVPKIKDFDSKNAVTFKGAELARALAEAAVAAGEATMNQDYTNVKIKVSAGYGELITTNGQQLAIVKLKDVDGNFTCIAPFMLLNTAIKAANMDHPITIALSKDERNIMVSYPLVYGGQAIGTVEYQLPVFEWFPKYEKKISSISPLTECRVLTEELKNACAILGVVELSKTLLKVQTGKKPKMIFQKTEARGSLDQVEVPLEKVSGKDFEVWVSARHLEAAVAKADKEYVDLVFTGRTSICKIRFGDDDGKNFEQYFAPYTEA